MSADKVAGCLLGCSQGTLPLGRSGAGRQYYQCQGCGLAFVRRLPAASHLESQYLEDASSRTSYYRGTEAADTATFRRSLRLLARFQPERGRLLDVGCSVGTLMRVAREMGWQVEGMEANPEAARLARKQGFAVQLGFFEPPLVRSLQGTYQCVVMSGVIEHLCDPDQALGLAGELLAPEGLLLVATPNLESFWCRRFQLKPLEHLFLFNSGNLSHLLTRKGFDLCHLEKTSRRRALSQLKHSTTEIGRPLEILVTALGLLRLDGVCAVIMEHLFRDELIVIARKVRRASS
jgi:2-polyprenyl-3-methyl-5-hydroxy-6-metoxy-1,4-benzoquinol methylase